MAQKVKDAKILIVDDDRFIRESVADLLAGEYDVLKASSVEKAWEILLQKRPDCIVADIVMPGENGVDLLKRVREDGSDVPFIILTGRSSKEYAECCADLNVQGYIIKPVDETKLKKRIKKALASKGRADALPEIKPSGRTIDKVVDYLHKNYGEELSSDQVAGRFHISYGYLAELFKKEFGMSFSLYLIRLRVGEAKKLLRTTDLPLKEVATRVGFHSEPHFYRQFKRFTGLTPKSFANQREKKDGPENRQ